MTDEQSEPAGDGAASSAGAAPAETVEPGARWHMIATAAYYRARARGFRGGSPEEDWRAAEAEVDSRLRAATGAHAGAAAADERAAYQRLRDEVQQRLGAIRGNVDARAIQEAFERAVAQVRRAGEHAGTSVSRAAERLRKDMRQTAASIGPRWEELSERAAGVFSVWRDRGSEFLARAAAGLSDWLNRSPGRPQAAVLRTGETAAPGSYRCARCGHVVRLESAEALPACPACRHTEFQRAS